MFNLLMSFRFSNFFFYYFVLFSFCLFIIFSFFFVFFGDFLCNNYTFSLFFSNFYSYFNFCLFDIYTFNFDSFLFSLYTGYSYIDLFQIHSIRNFDLYSSYSVLSSFDSHFIKVSFLSFSNVSGVLFFPLNDCVYVLPNEPSIIFYKLVNTTDFPYRVLSVYTVLPYDYSFFLKKIQCFCFDELFVQPRDVLILPIFFLISGDLFNSFHVDSVELYIHYILMSVSH